MKKNVFVITGSPRKNGNSNCLVKEFIRGAEENGNLIERLDVAFQQISGCTACNSCWTKDECACIINDDWQVFATQLEKADVVVFAYPLYWSSMPSELKAAIDRLYSYCSPNTKRPLTGKKIVLLLCGECEGQGIFQNALRMHEGINGFFNWETIGMVLIDTVFESGAITKTDGPKLAYELGKTI